MQPQSPGSEGAGSELRSDANHLGRSAANRLHSEVDARKGSAAEQAKSVSTAMERTAGELDQGAPDWLKSAFRKGAEQVQRFADTLEQKDSRQIMHEVQGFARDKPGLFLFGCAAAGFAAARVLKAGESRSQSGEGAQSSDGRFGSEPRSFPTAARESDFSNSSRGEFA